MLTLARSRFIAGAGATAALAGCGQSQNSSILPDTRMLSASSASISPSVQNIQQQLQAVASSSGAHTVRGAISALLTNPAVPTLATSTIRSQKDLTSFQKSALDGIAIVTRDPSVLHSLILGLTLSSGQKQALSSIKADLSKNAAYQAIIVTANKLKAANSGTLQSDVQEIIGNSVRLEKPMLPGLTGNAQLDSVLKDIATLQRSKAFADVRDAFVPIMKETAFTPWLKAQSAQVVGSFIPSTTIVALPLLVTASSPTAVETLLQTLMWLYSGAALIVALAGLLDAAAFAAFIAGTFGYIGYLLTPVALPNVITEQESYEDTFKGKWTRSGLTYSAAWNNGALATITVASFSDLSVVLNRADNSGVSAGLTAVYTAIISDTNSISRGIVTWTWPGHFGPTDGTWSATWG